MLKLKASRDLALDSDYLTPAEVAELRGVTRATVYLWINAGIIQHECDRRGKLFIRRKVALKFKAPPIGRPRKE